MKRRVGLRAVLGAWAWPLSLQVRAQQPAKPRLVAILAFSSPQSTGWVIEDLKRTLRELGWIEGGNVVYETRWAEGRVERLPAIARELVALRPDVIWTAYTSGALAARQATRTIPIVQVGADPVGAGLAQSLARPGGNVTGLSNVNADIGPKLLELMREVVPGAARVGVLWNPDNPTNLLILTKLRAGAESLRVSALAVEARTLPEIEQALLRMSRERVDAVIVLTDGLFVANGRRIGDLLAEYRLPSAVQGRAHLALGGMLSYAVSIEELNRRGAYYIDRILKGAKPAELPIEQPTRFELVINLKVAKALGLTIPQALLLRADEVIE